MADKPELPAVGALVTIGGVDLTVHCDCKEVRDGFERFLRKRAGDDLDVMFREKEITAAEYAARKNATFNPLAFAWGSQAFSDASDTDEGIKRMLWLRIKLNHPQVKFEDVAKWVDDRREPLPVDPNVQTVGAQDPAASTPPEPIMVPCGWKDAKRLMMIADANAPK